MGFPFELPLVLDGDYKTNLISGVGVKYEFENIVLNNPKKIFDLQGEFIKNGSQAITTPTSFCNKSKLKEFGLENNVEEINFNFAKTTKKIAGENVLVGGTISKTDLSIQPFGETKFIDLIDIYYNQVIGLSKGKVDFFLIYDMDNLSEIRASIFACKKTNIPIFLTININEQDINIKKEVILSYLISTQDLGISAFGINGDIETDEIENIFNELKKYAKIPIIFKPNAGKPNPILQNLYDLSPKYFVDSMNVDKLLDLGVYIFGGDLGSKVEHIKAIKTKLKNKVYKHALQNKSRNIVNDIVLSNKNQIFILKENTIEFTSPIKCSIDMSESFLQVEQKAQKVIFIELVSPEDSILFCLNQYMTKLPICFISDNEIALKTALMLFNGKALVDKNSSIKKDVLINICNKYGAILY